MKKVIFLLSMTLAVCFCHRVDKSEEEHSAVKDVITKKEALYVLHKWTNAYLTNNPNTLDEVLDDTWVYSGPSNGVTLDKKTTIEGLIKADYTYNQITFQDLEVDLYQDMAIVRGSEKMVILGSFGQDTTTLRLRFTDVYQKKNGVVKAISTHSSPIEEQ